MAENLGSGVSRTLSALERAFQLVVWQSQKPPLDSEFNLMGQVDLERMRNVVRSMMHSGCILDPTRATADFVTDSSWSNYFKLGSQVSGELEPIIWANVNGWILPVAGTAVSAATDLSNLVKLYPPPATDTRIDLVFLEVWMAPVAPNPSTSNKPSASTIWKWGNVEYGSTNITDDIEDPTKGYETTERIQLQYRIRVFGSGEGLGASVSLDKYPDGLDDPNVLGQGAATAPVTGLAWSNMRETLGDPGLWRAGDGDSGNDLTTMDGYTYAIPLCAIFRRNSDPFVAVEAAGNANQNGAFDRNPSAVSLTDPRDGAKALVTATLTNAIDEDDTGVIQINTLTGSGLDDPNITIAATHLVIDDEVISISAIDTAASPATVTIPTTNGRGRHGTMALPHAAASTIQFFNSRPDSLFADEIASQDILDLRRSVSTVDWDYSRLLAHNLRLLVQGKLRSSYKQSGSGDTEGPSVVEADYMLADGSTAVPNQTEAVDGPDGIRTIFSDAAVVQPHITVMLDEDATQVSGLVTAFDTNVEWDVGADFKPGGFMTNATGFDNGAVLFLHIGGDAGTEGARATFRDGSERAVRFVSPREYWKAHNTDATTGLQAPVTLRFNDEPAMSPTGPGETLIEHPGPMYPLALQNFEKPFIVLGGLLHASLQVGSPTLFNDSPGATQYEIDLPGLDFDTAGTWFTKSGGKFVDDASAVTNAVLRGERTLYDMLTNGGKDTTGSSSEVYLILWGDNTKQDNNGAFRVIGAGATAGYTDNNASAADRVRVEFLTQGVTQFDLVAGGTLTAEIRSQHMNAEDGSGSTAGIAALAIAITDIAAAHGSAATNPWHSGNLGALAITAPVVSKLILSTSLLYHPGRGATARVPDDIWRVATVGGGSEYLRQSPATLDSAFPAVSGMPSNETFFEPVHVQTWNRPAGMGLHAPDAPDYGGQIVAFSEQDRENECFFDRGSKTLIFRPFLDRSMSTRSNTLTGSELLVGSTGVYPGPNPPVSTPKDGAIIWTAGGQQGFEVPPEYMPRFGRQDIPYHDSAGTGTFLPGINHLFTDAADETEPVFNIIGGQDNQTAGNLVTSMYFQTGTTSGQDYGEYATIVGPGTAAYQARLMIDASILSSDFGRGMEGIEMPPHVGLARVYGVYDRRDFVAKGGATFESDRVTTAASPAINLLRKDATKNTLFINKDGAFDVTASTGDHTYVIPSNAIDIELSPDFVAGETFSDLEYVVEAVVFGFARNFINANNYVHCRLHNGEGTTRTDATDIELEGVHMTIPAAAPLNDAMYVGYTRTVYQGDPYMSRSGDTRTTSDYEHRYGQVSVTNAFELASAIEQYDSAGATIPEIPNARGVQVLAALDFYTTMGTGKIGGRLYAGSLLDVAYTQNSATAATRVPSSATDAAWKVLPRAFSESQRENTTRAALGIEITDNASLATAVITVTRLDGTDVTLTAVAGGPTTGEYLVGADAEESAANLAVVINGLGTLAQSVTASSRGSTVCTFESVPVGAEGNSIEVTIDTPTVMAVLVPTSAEPGVGDTTAAFLAGGVDTPVNAGAGSTQIDLTGMTERLPLGILFQDSDFIGENILGDNASAMQTSSPGIRPVQTLLPLTQDGGQEYTRFVGGPGHLLGLADGGILQYTAFDTSGAPTGTKRFRLFRGGGSAYVMTGPNPGGPVDWVSENMPASITPVLKGGVLVCKALLVRNWSEQAFATDDQTTQGDEIQMVVLTYGLMGDPTTTSAGINLSGIISPTGYGEGYAAADRYRLEGKPLVNGDHRTPPDAAGADLAVFPFDISTEIL